MTRLSLSLLTLAGLLTVTTAYAKLYKWVDEKGQVHYTQHKPAIKGLEIQEVGAPPPPPVDSIDVNEKYWKEFKGGKESPKEETTPSKANADADLKRQQCDQAKKNLDNLVNRARVFYTNDAGERVKMGEDERESRMAEARKNVKFFCE